MLTFLKRLAGDWFLVGMVLAVLLASAVPSVGRSGGTLQLDHVAHIGIFAVFFLHGIGLSTEKMRQGIARWPVHLVVQMCTFVLFPALWFAFSLGAGGWMPRDLLLGFLYLCALPSTISSSVALTAAARGNVPAAIFNATLSTLLGIVLTPLVITLAMGQAGQGLEFGSSVQKIAALLLLPFALGQLLRPLCGAWFAARKQWTGFVDRGVILLLVFNSFSDSVADGLWSRHGVSLLLLTLAGSALLLAIALTFSWFCARRLGFSTEDEVTTVFCGSKKTLASGVPMAKLLFGAHPALGVIVLPIMFYHQLQLLVCSVLARRYAERANP